jgi:hypothetical protein
MPGSGARPRGDSRVQRKPAASQTPPASTDIRLKRVYEPADPSDGRRVLVDRLWPRGLSREDAQVDEWARELAPSDSLRRWYGHDPRTSTSSAAVTWTSSARAAAGLPRCGAAREPGV